MEPGGRTGHCISRPGCFETAETPQNGCRARTRVELLLKPRRVAIESAAATPKASLDRKSTRLNSSHSQISYAVFCLKKKINSTLTSLLQQLRASMEELNDIQVTSHVACCNAMENGYRFTDEAGDVHAAFVGPEAVLT